jgi:hypothetical protein
VKGLKRQPLPGGFMARLQSRRARASEPTRDWVFLPPTYRPVAAAMSMAIVAFVVWDKARGPEELVRNVWNSEHDHVAIKTAAQLPSSLDVSGRLSAMGVAGGAGGVAEAVDEISAKKQRSLIITAAGRRAAAPGKPLDVLEQDNRDQGDVGLKSITPGAASAPAAAPAREPASATPVEGQSFQARSEEERSAINERLYKNFKEEKQRMGIASIIAKDSQSDDQYARERSDVMTLNAAPESFRLNRTGWIGTMRGAAKKAKLQESARAKSEAPEAGVKALALKSNEALQAAWGAASLPGEPPAVDFPHQMALFLAGPRGCGIVSVEQRKKSILVLYKDSGLDDASRVRAVAISSKSVVVKPAP